MEVDLSRTWNGRRAPRAQAGKALVTVRRERLELGWDLGLPDPPQAPPTPVGFTDGLWAQDVVELFLRGEREGRYVEIEVGVAGHWLALSFDGVRHRDAELRELPIVVVSDVRDGRWRGRAEIALSPLAAILGARPWRGLVTAVTGLPRGEIRAHLCWPALPGDAPDFHQPDAWAELV